MTTAPWWLCCCSSNKSRGFLEGKQFKFGCFKQIFLDENKFRCYLCARSIDHLRLMSKLPFFWSVKYREVCRVNATAVQSNVATSFLVHC